MKCRFFIIMILLCLLFTSCSAKKALVEQIEIGMSMEEVHSLLGHPDKDLGSGTVIDQYLLSNEEVAIISYTIDSDGVFRVSQIYVGAVVD